MLDGRSNPRAFRMNTLPPFHLAFPVSSLASARAFYGELLGCPEGRSSEDWVDFDFHGHQIVAHLAPEEACAVAAHDVDGDAVPVRHFGLVLSMEAWQGVGRSAAPGRHAFRHRAAYPLCRPAGRAGHDVPARPERECAGVQGVRRSLAAVREVTRTPRA